MALRAGDRSAAADALGAELDADWPAPDLLDVLPGTEPFGAWAIVERATSTVIGDIGFHGPPDADGVVEIGYSVVPSRRRRGYAVEAARGLIAWAIAQPGVKTIVAGSTADNAASIATLERLGFERTGVADGELRWSWLRRAGAGRVLRSRGETSSDISLPHPSRSREWLKVALLECRRCHQVVERSSPVQRHCPDCRAGLKRARSRAAVTRARAARPQTQQPDAEIGGARGG